MKKSNAIKLAFAVSLFVVAVLLVIGAVAKEQFKFGWLDAVIYLCAAWSVCCVIAAFVFENKQGTFIGAWVLGAICFGVAIPRGLHWSISLILMFAYLAFLVLLRSLAFRRYQWDRGDNQKPGYKDYKTRKAEREAAEAAAKQPDPFETDAKTGEEKDPKDPKEGDR